MRRSPLDMDEISPQQLSHRTVVIELSEESRARRAVPYTKTDLIAYPLSTRHSTTLVLMPPPEEDQTNGTTAYYPVGVYRRQRRSDQGYSCFRGPAEERSGDLLPRTQ